MSVDLSHLSEESERGVSSVEVSDDDSEESGVQDMYVVLRNTVWIPKIPAGERLSKYNNIQVYYHKC